MFTKISKVVLWIGVVACFILSIAFGTSVKGWEFLVMLGGWVATLIIFSVFGMVVEMAENIRESRELLETMSRNSAQTNSISSTAPASVASPSYNPSAISNENRTPSVQQNGKPSLIAANGGWRCPSCGLFNAGSRKYCENCDSPKS